MNHPKDMLNERIQYLDVARGMTILMIVAFHVLGETILIYHHFVATMGLQVFLFVTGYFFRRFDWKNNFKKLVIPYILLLITVRCYWDIRMHCGYTTQIADVAKQIILGYTIDDMWLGNGFFVGISWFFPLLFVTKLLYSLICKLTKQNELSKGVFCLALSCVGVIFGQKGMKLPWSIDVAMATLPFLYLGEVARIHAEKFQVLCKNICVMLVSFVAWGLLVYYFGISEMATRSYPQGMTFLMSSSFAMLAVFCLACCINHHLPQIGRFFAVIGKYSFVVLCAHILDKSCIIHAADISIYWLVLEEILIAIVPVGIICVIKEIRKRKKDECK